jgi:EAL domain-containing protein (putative c-di-GMP-specific phosphodiesterase class I)
VELETLAVVGYEALTRFSDGTAPDVRFADATAHELGAEFELVTMEAAIHASARLPAGAFLSLNASPAVIVAQRRRLQEILRECGRRVVLELTEHAAVDDYPTLVRSMDKLKGVDVAIDDAGAGYSSLRHVLELRPRFVKLDISLVRGIDGDDIRRSLVAGLVYFAARTGYDLIAEGIETQAEADALSELGVQLAQGYLFHRPARA